MSDPSPADFDVWILAGQSNMQGCGLLRESLPSDPRVWNFSSAGQWEPAQEPLHRLWESFTENHPTRLRAGDPLADGKTNLEMAAIARQTQVTGAGLGIAFGRVLAEATGKHIGLIPCAHGGTTLLEWDFTKKTTLDLYGGMLERVQKAGGHLRGILWYQGESDAMTLDAADYCEKLANWVRALRSDLGEDKLPFYAVQLGRVIVSAPEPKLVTGWEHVREALRSLPESLSHCAITSAIDLGLTDFIHIDSPGLLRLGERLGKLALGEKNPTVTSIVRDREEEQIRGGLGVVQICCNEHGSTWKKIHPLSGFTVLDTSGLPHPTCQLIQAEVAINDPTALRLILSSPPDATVRVGYGLGLNPYCNVVDERDLPLMAFLPQPVEG